MAVVWIEGFETHRHATALGRKYHSGSSINTVTFQSGRLFGYSMRAQDDTVSFLRTPALAAATTLTAGLGFRCTGAVYTAASWSLLNFLDTSLNEEIEVQIADGASGYLKLLVVQGGLTLAESVEFPVSSDWRHLEAQVVSDGSAGTIEVRLNQETLISLSSLNTSGSGNDLGYVEFGCTQKAGSVFEVDDLYVTDQSGDDSNTQGFLGNVCVEGVLPNADGSDLDWSPSTGSDHFAVVDDDPTTSSPETDYLEAGGIDYLKYPRPQEAGGGLVGLQVDLLAFLSTAGSEALKLLHLKDGTAAQIGSNITVTSTSPDMFNVTLDKDPDKPDDTPFDVDYVSEDEHGLFS